MEGERTETEEYESPSVAVKPRKERRTSPSESIFGSPQWHGEHKPIDTELQLTKIAREASEETEIPRPVTLGAISTEKSSVEERGFCTSHTKSAGYIGDYKRGHARSVKLMDVASISESSDEPFLNIANPSKVSGISEKDQRWQHPANGSDSLLFTNLLPDKTRTRSQKSPVTASGNSSMVPIPASGMSPSVLLVNSEEKKLLPFFDVQAIEQQSNKALRAFYSLALMHLICVLVFGANTYFVPMYYLKDHDTGVEIGKITFQDIEISCEECDESSTLTSESYLNICGIGETNADFTEGFITDYKTAAFFSFLAFAVAAGNIAIIFVLFCLLLGRKITDQLSQFLILFGGLVSLGELLLGLVVPLQTQLGTWNRDKVNNIFSLSEFACEGTIYVYSSFGFLLVWLALGCVLLDIVLTQRFFTFVRVL